MTHKGLEVSMSVELESGKGWVWVIDVEDFCGKQFAMSGQYQLIELSESKFLSICHFVAGRHGCTQSNRLTFFIS